jgi:hypothetical protein
MSDGRGVTGVRPAANAEAARWLLDADVFWGTLVRYGPPGFDVYVRIAFAAATDDVDEDGDVESPSSLRTALATLAAHTTTPATGYAAIWEGWGGGPIPDAPRVDIPNRAMLLVTGAVDVLRDAPFLASRGGAALLNEGPGPHLAWPEDRAWCLACEVDEEIEFSVGCSLDAAQALDGALPGVVRRVQYGEAAPLYLDELSDR